jgi:LPS export ABC transporter protein LptC
MTNPRLLRGGLVFLFLVVLLWTVATLRHPSSRPGADPATSAGRAGKNESRVGDFTYRGFKEGVENFLVKAETMEGSQQETVHFKGVTTTFRYRQEGKEGKTTVKADSCAYTGSSQKAEYQGHVVLTTEDGLELHSESLIYRGDKQLARTDAPVDFRNGRFSGTSKGMIYKADQGEIDLIEDAYVRVEDDKGGPPTEVHSHDAVAKREDGTLSFNDAVRMTRSGDTLTAGNRLLSFSTEDRSLVAAQAVENVDLERAPGSAPLPGLGASVGKGPRTLKCAKLVMSFRHDRTPETATAGGGAEFIALPGPGEVQERRDLKARALLFAFDEKGRVNEIQGQKEVVFHADPLQKGAGLLPRTGSCNSFVAEINPDTGETTSAEFQKDVVFTRGRQKAHAQKASYSGQTELLSLKAGPELVDEEQGASLMAEGIDLSTRTGDIVARHTVRNVLKRGSGTKRSGKSAAPKEKPPGEKGEEPPTLLTCEHFDQTAKTQTTRCEGSALLRRGRDEIRAPVITLGEDSQGRQHLEADLGVATLMYPEPRPGQKPPEKVVGTAQRLVYEEARGEIVYTAKVPALGGVAVPVRIQQADLLCESPLEATMTLSGDTLRSIVVGEPVTVTQKDPSGSHSRDRVGTGTRAIYDPVAGTVLVVGKNVVLHDMALPSPSQQVQGRSLTFRTGDSRVLVDGREEARTETVLRREPVRP